MTADRRRGTWWARRSVCGPGVLNAWGGRRRGRRREQVRRQSQQRGSVPAKAEDRAAIVAVGTAVAASGDWVAGALAGDGDAKAEAARGAGEPLMGGNRWMDGRGRSKARADVWAAAYGRRHTRTACGSPTTEERGRRTGGHGRDGQPQMGGRRVEMDPPRWRAEAATDGPRRSADDTATEGATGPITAGDAVSEDPRRRGRPR